MMNRSVQESDLPSGCANFNLKNIRRPIHKKNNAPFAQLFHRPKDKESVSSEHFPPPALSFPPSIIEVHAFKMLYPFTLCTDGDLSATCSQGLNGFKMFSMLQRSKKANCKRMRGENKLERPGRRRAIEAQPSPRQSPCYKSTGFVSAGLAVGFEGSLAGTLDIVMHVKRFSEAAGCRQSLSSPQPDSSGFLWLVLLKIWLGVK